MLVCCFSLCSVVLCYGSLSRLRHGLTVRILGTLSMRGRIAMKQTDWAGDGDQNAPRLLSRACQLATLLLPGLVGTGNFLRQLLWRKQRFLGQTCI